MSLGIKFPRRINGNSVFQGINNGATSYVSAPRDFLFQTDWLGESEILPTSIFTFKRLNTVDQESYDAGNPIPVSLDGLGLGGLIDNINLSFDPSKDTYLIWAICDPQEQFQGIGCTRRPRGNAITIISGNANKGTLANFDLEAVPENPYQFTIGACVLLRDFEGNYNWGVINNINHLPQPNITIQLFNNPDFGTNLTNPITGGEVVEIIQYNIFRPYIISAVNQVLYSSVYQLIGDIWFNDIGEIEKIVRADDPWRPVDTSIYPPTRTFPYIIGSNPGIATQLADSIPFWANRATMRALSSTTTTVKFHLATYDFAATLLNTGVQIDFMLKKNTLFPIDVTALLAGNLIIQPKEYYVNGGMTC